MIFMVDETKKIQASVNERRIYEKQQSLRQVENFSLMMNQELSHPLTLILFFASQVLKFITSIDAQVCGGKKEKD